MNEIEQRRLIVRNRRTRSSALLHSMSRRDNWSRKQCERIDEDMTRVGLSKFPRTIKSLTFPKPVILDLLNQQVKTCFLIEQYDHLFNEHQQFKDLVRSQMHYCGFSIDLEYDHIIHFSRWRSEDSLRPLEEEIQVVKFTFL